MACKLRTTVRFSKYEFYNKLLGDITLLGLTWTQSYIYIYVYIYYGLFILTPHFLHWINSHGIKI